MAQGKKYNNDIKEKAFALLACNNSVAQVARELGLKYTTVKTWEQKFIKQGNGTSHSDVVKNGQPKENDEENLVKLRNQKKEEFVNSAWNLIKKAQILLERRLDRALNYEDELDEIVESIISASDEELKYQQKQALLVKMRSIKVEDIREIATVLGTLYDKQALAKKEATQIVDGGIQIEFNIPRPPTKDGKANED